MKEQIPTMPPQAVIVQMAASYWISKSLYAVAQLGIADQLNKKPMTAVELAKATNCHPSALYRVLRALASVGVFSEDTQGRFTQTPLSETMRSDIKDSTRPLILMVAGEQFDAWGPFFKHSMMHEETTFDKVFGCPIFEYLAAHPESAKIFHAAMDGVHGPENGAIAEAYDFSKFHTVVDVGGGNGSLLSPILARYPNVKGVLVDTKAGIAAAKAGTGGPLPRCELVVDDFFKSVPSGGDAYLLKHIIHDWNDEEALKILSNCRKAMQKGGTLLILESVIPLGNAPSFGKLLDLHMMVVTGGRERTEPQYKDLLEKTGFRLQKVMHTKSNADIVEAVAV